MAGALTLTDQDRDTLAATFLNPARLFDPFVPDGGSIPAATREVASLANLYNPAGPGETPVTATYVERAHTWACDPGKRRITWTDTMMGTRVLRWFAAYVTLHEGGHDRYTTRYEAPPGVFASTFHHVMNGAEDVRMERMVTKDVPGFATLAEIARERIATNYRAAIAANRIGGAHV